MIKPYSLSLHIIIQMHIIAHHNICNARLTKQNTCSSACIHHRGTNCKNTWKIPPIALLPGVRSQGSTDVWHPLRHFEMADCQTCKPRV